jgi:hypothetical protein
MTDDRNANGYFNRGNTLSKGRPRGSRNKPRTWPFTEDGDTSAPARRFRMLTLQMVADLGGSNNLSAGQKQLIKRCAMISVECERMEKSAMDGGDLNAAAYGSLTGQLNRTLNTLGLKREPIDVTPALHQYLDTLQPAEPIEPQVDLTIVAED